MNFIADIFTTPIQYGQRTDMCKLLLSKEFQNDTLAGLGTYAQNLGIETADYHAPFLQNTTIDTSKAMRQWTYQYCTEFGFFGEPNLKRPMRSQSLGPSFWLDWCKRVFTANLPAPDVDTINEKFGGLNIKGKNIYFFTASEDPWQYVGMRKIHNPQTQSGMKTWYIDCTDCAHCIDLNPPSDSDAEILKNGRADAYSTITYWLAQDRAKSGHGISRDLPIGSFDDESTEDETQLIQ